MSALQKACIRNPKEHMSYCDTKNTLLTISGCNTGGMCLFSVPIIENLNEKETTKTTSINIGYTEFRYLLLRVYSMNL